MEQVNQLLEIASRARKGVDYEACWETLLNKAENLGIKVLVSSDKNLYPWGWDGTTIRIEDNKVDRKVKDLAHELAHWMVAPKSRRHMIEFGLGMGFSTELPDGMWNTDIRKVSEANCDREELATCIVAAVILDEIRADVLEESMFVNMVEEHIDEYRWCPINLCSGSYVIKEMISHLNLAFRRKALNSNLTVNWEVRK